MEGNQQLPRGPRALPEEVLANIGMLHALGTSTLGDARLVCRSWNSIVSRTIGRVLVERNQGRMTPILASALEHDKLEVAVELVSAPGSEEDANAALRLVAKGGHTELARILLAAPRHAAHADCFNGDALVQAAAFGHVEIVHMLLDAPQHAAHADCLNGQALVNAAYHGHIEIVRLLLDAPQHAAHANCQDGEALRLAASEGNTIIIVKMDWRF
eukprot:gene7379-biopygen17186